MLSKAAQSIKMVAHFIALGMWHVGETKLPSSKSERPISTQERQRETAATEHTALLRSLCTSPVFARASEAKSMW